MSRAPEGQYTDEHLDLVHRQISLWETNGEVAEGLADWLPDGVLEAPRGIRVEAADLPASIGEWHRSFRDLRIELVTLFVSSDSEWLAIEWTWTATRRRDGATGVTPDAIIVRLRNNKIASWREYFDTANSVEFDAP